MKAEIPRKAALVLLGMAAAFGGLAFSIYRLDEPQRERFAIREIVEDIERSLSAHDGSERAILDQAGAAPANDTDRQQLRADIERLARLERLRFFGVRIEIDVDTGAADYAIEAHALPGAQPPPRGGRFLFRRVGSGWSLAGHRFHPGSAAAGTAPPLSSSSRTRRPHIHRWTREPLVVALAGVAALAALGAVAFLISAMVTHAGPSHGRRRAGRTRR